MKTGYRDNRRKRWRKHRNKLFLYSMGWDDEYNFWRTKMTSIFRPENWKWWWNKEFQIDCWCDVCKTKHYHMKAYYWKRQSMVNQHKWKPTIKKDKVLLKMTKWEMPHFGRNRERILGTRRICLPKSERKH